MEIREPRALPDGLSVQKRLYFHWLRSAERLTALMSRVDYERPLNDKTEYSPQRIRQLNAIILGHELLTIRMRRIERYLGYKRKQSMEDAHSWLGPAKLIRGNVLKGDSEDAIAILLQKLCEPVKKRGRPPGTGDSESVAATALELLDSNPGYWTWSKIADRLLKCKTHTAHESDSECVNRLKQAVARLRDFLEELEAD